MAIMRSVVGGIVLALSLQSVPAQWSPLQRSVAHYTSFLIPVGASIQGLGAPGNWSQIASDGLGGIVVAEPSYTPQLQFSIRTAVWSGATNGWQFATLASNLPDNPLGLAASKSHYWYYTASDAVYEGARRVPQVPTLRGNLRSLLGLPSGWTIGECCTNGRDVFYLVATGSDWRVYALDMLGGSPPVSPPDGRLVAVIPPTTAAYAGDLDIGRDGNLVIVTFGGSPGPKVLCIDAVDGTLLWQEAVPTWTSYGKLAFDAWESRVSVAHDGNLGEIIEKVLGSTGTWTLLWYFPYLTLFDVETMVCQPFEVFGSGCANSAGSGPRVSWQGLPLQGQSFDVKLREAEASGFACLWLGISDTSWLGLPLPYDAMSVGAPGCNLLVSVDIPYAVPVDANGRASISVAVPVNQELAGLEVFAQTASTCSVNSFGFASSDALIVRVR